MKIFLLLLFLFISNISLSMKIEIHGSAAKYIQFDSTEQSFTIYAQDQKGQKILIYKSDYVIPISEDYIIIGANKKNEVLMIYFNCGTHYQTCFRVLSLENNYLTPIYKNLKLINYDQKVGFFYDKEKSLVSIKPLFEACKKPLTFILKIYPDSIFAGETDFHEDGDLQIDYAEPLKGDDATQIYHIDYKKLYANCRD